MFDTSLKKDVRLAQMVEHSKPERMSFTDVISNLKHAEFFSSKNEKSDQAGFK